MKSTVGASRRIFFTKTPKDGRDGHTYGVSVYPTSVEVMANGIPAAEDLIQVSPTVTMWCDGIDVTANTKEFALRRTGIRAADGVSEKVWDSITKIGQMGIRYSSICFEMIPAYQAIDGSVPVLASATLVFARQGATGATGAFVPPPSLWVDYSDDYEFKAGAEGETRLDVVLDGYKDVNGNRLPVSWKCKKSHTKGKGIRPSKDEEREFWDMGDVHSILATQVLLADTANIALTSTQAIRVYDNDRNIVGEFSGAKDPKRIISSSVSGGPIQVASLSATDGAALQPGTGGSVSAITEPVYLPLWLGGVMNEDGSFRKNPTFGVGTDGCMYLGGFNSGRRLIIDPNTTDADGKVSPTITLFNSDGERAVTIDGGRHEIGDLYDFSSSFRSAPAGDYKRVTTEPVTDSLGTVKVGAAGGRLKASMSVGWQVQTGYYNSSDNGVKDPSAIVCSTVSASLYIVSKASGDAVPASRTELKERGPAWPPGTDVPAAGKTAYKSESGTATVSIEADLPQGEYELMLERWVDLDTIDSRVTPGGTLSIANPTQFKPEFSAGADYKAFLGADGLLIAKSSTEYFRCGMSGGNLEFEANIGSHGIRVTRGGVYAKKSDGSWDSLLVDCEKAAADANLCVCDQLGTRMFTTNDSTANLPDKGLSGTNFGTITATTFNPQAGHHIQEWKTFTQPVHCWSRRCMSGTWGVWTKNY